MDREKEMAKSLNRVQLEKIINDVCELIYFREKNIERIVESVYCAVVEDRRQSVKGFADYLCEYAEACKQSGYDGIGANDIQEKFEEWYGKDCN